MTERYLAGDAFLRLPSDDPPPLKTKVLRMSPYGILSIGPWDQRFVLWCPLSEIPPHIKEAMKK